MSASSIYTQSIRSGRKFRLLTIRPALDPHRQLECDCGLFDIDEAPPYEALSYVWGSSRHTQQITCNGQSVTIQAGLEDILKVLRLRDEQRTIWVDALCINQNDNEEKNHQVPLMGSVYSTAKRVVVWLGHEDSEQASTAFECLEYISQACSQFNRDHGLSVDYCGRDYDALKLPVESFNPPVCNSLRELFHRSWFSRIWCVQEIHLAREGLVLWGEHEISWEVLSRGLSWIYYQAGTELYLGHGDPVASLLFDTNVFKAAPMRGASYKPLLETLVQYHGMNSTNPRDKVYGLTSLMGTKKEVDALGLNYNKSVGEVYADTVLVGIQLYSRLTAFTWVSHPPDYDGGPDEYRSWAPRWDIKTQLVTLGDPERRCPWTPCGREAILIPNPNPRHLTLRGIPFSPVLKVDPIMHFSRNGSIYTPDSDAPDPSTIADTMHPLRKLLTAIWPLAASGIPDEERVKRLYYLARTVTAGTCPFPLHEYAHRLTPDIRERYYEAFIHLLSRISYLEDNPSSQDDYPHTPDSRALELSMQYICDDRRIFWTQIGFGLGPGCVREGDVVVVLHGGNTPYVLRPRGGGEYVFLGQAYVDEIMYGECMLGLLRGVGEGEFELG